MFWVQILPLPPPPHFFNFFILFNTFLYIVQYLLFWFTSPIPHITPYHQHCLHIHPDPPTNPTPPPTRPPPPHLTPPLTLKNFNSPFTSTLTPPPLGPDPTPPPPNFFSEFSQKLQFFAFISTLIPPPPPPPEIIFF